jgi:hypothetical protein
MLQQAGLDWDVIPNTAASLAWLTLRPTMPCCFWTGNYREGLDIRAFRAMRLKLAVTGKIKYERDSC